MLTGDLVRARTAKKKLRLQYVDPSDPENIDLAQELIALFEQSEGGPREELKSVLAQRLGTGTEFVLQRGLAKLLEDRSTFEVVADTDPMALRNEVFEAAARAYRDAEFLVFDREEVLAPLREQHDLTSEQLDRHLYADLKQNHCLVSFERIEPEDLLHRYNLALAQAALLRAFHVEITLRGVSANRLRELFRVVRFHRLLHEIIPESDGAFRLILDGPLSLFRSTQNYGLQLALFLPHLIRAESFALKAKVLWGKQKKEMSFEIDSESGLQSHVRSLGQWTPEDVDFLKTRLQEVSDAWLLRDDVSAIKVEGQSLIIPDFVAHHQETGFEVSIEVLGYWRKSHVHSRLETLKRLPECPYLLAVSRDYLVADEDYEDLSEFLYVFKTTPIAKEVLARLEQIRAQMSSS